MANWGAFAILVLAIIVVAYLWGNQISNAYQYYASQAYTTYATTATNNALQLHPKVGQQICSLKVVFTPFLGANIVPPIYVRIDHGASQINWYSCTSSTPALDWAWLTPQSLVPLDALGGNDLLGLFNPSPAGYKFSGTLVADDGTQTHPTINPVPAVGINNNLSGVGQTFTMTFIFQNIPRQHYSLQITSDSIGINQAGSGNTYYQSISP